jgi:hypothetical protein
MRVKAASAFGANRRRPDGLQAQCRACKSENARDWYDRRGHAQRRRNRAYIARNVRHLWDYLLTHPCVD